LFDHYLGPKNASNTTSTADIKLARKLYNGEKKRFTFETYVRIHTKHHAILNCLKEYGYSGIDECSNVRHVMKAIKTTELDVCKANIMDSPNLREDFAGTVELYLTFIKQTKAETQHMNVSEVNYSKGKQGGGRSHSGKRCSSGISNSNQGSSSNVAADDRFYEKHDYLDLYSDQKNTLHLKRVKHGHMPNRE
jgi:hypothetical protein